MKELAIEVGHATNLRQRKGSTSLPVTESLGSGEECPWVAVDMGGALVEGPGKRAGEEHRTEHSYDNEYDLQDMGALGGLSTTYSHGCNSAIKWQLCRESRDIMSANVDLGYRSTPFVPPLTCSHPLIPSSEVYHHPYILLATHDLHMITKSYDTIYTAVTRDGTYIDEFKLQPQPSSRATRLVGDSTRFLLVSVSKKANDYKLRENLVQWIRGGVPVNGVP